MNHYRSSETKDECCISTCSNWMVCSLDILLDIYSLHCRPHHDMWYRARVSIQRIKEWKNTMSINKGSRQVILQADQLDKIDSSGSVCIHLFYQCSRSFFIYCPHCSGLVPAGSILSRPRPFNKAGHPFLARSTCPPLHYYQQLTTALAHYGTTMSETTEELCSIYPRDKKTKGVEAV